MSLQNRLKCARETERYCYERYLYWRLQREELERLVDSEAANLDNESDDPFEEFLGELWEQLDNDRGLD